ncbi:anaphase-promoting complex subunit cdc27 [Coemansia sp. RSA 1933]|nr:anaphase-promoting complex subunit cdc27 [Coemansia sp. RSA 1933]
MLGRQADHSNRQRRTARAAEKAPLTTSTSTTRSIAQKGNPPSIRAAEATKAAATHLPQHKPAKQGTEEQPHVGDSSSNSAECTLGLGRPQNEATRSYYEQLIARGISLLQPHSVVFMAETYHGWYHHAAADMAGNILQQTVGFRRNPSSNRDTITEGYDIRSVYWLALCHWHLGEISPVYSLLTPLVVETESVLEGADGDSETVTRSASGSNRNGVSDAEGSDAAAAGSSGGDLLLSAYESPRARTHKALACALWLLAMSCTRLDKWQEAEDYLTMLLRFLKHIYLPDSPGNSTGADIRHAVKSNTSIYVIPTAADISDLLGMVCIRTNRMVQSEIHSIDALQRNPLLWPSCRRLCELGSTQGISKLLGTSVGDIGVEKGSHLRRTESSDERMPVPGPRHASRIGTFVGSEQNDDTHMNTSVAIASKTADTRKASKEVPTKTPRAARVDLLAGSEKKRTRNGSMVKSASKPKGHEQQSVETAHSNNKGGDGLDLKAISHLSELVKLSGGVCLNMLSFHAPEALVAFSRLPIEQQNSAWGLCMLGRVCFEAGRYPEAAQAFSLGHRLAPFRVRDMDTYSTLLWHMKREETLAQLAHTMVSIGRTWSPEAWIAVANCFSLDGDHASALKSLARSIQLYKSSHGGVAVVPRSDSGGVGGLAYAHTLVGHENAASGEFDRAQQAFRTALRIDPRHYNSWYGMGMSYLRLGKLDLAEYHFRRSLALNSQNPLLLQSAGALYENRGDFGRALGVYERVEKLLQEGYSIDAATAKLNSLAGSNAKDGGAFVADEGVVLELQQHHAMNFVLFRRARVLVILERFKEAAVILEKLLQRCPREFNVPFLLGQTYTKLRRYREAAACLSRALDIAPENIQSVREAFDALYMQDSDGQEFIMSQELGDGSVAQSGNPPMSDAQNQDGSLETPSARPGGAGPMLSSSSSMESPYFESPSMYAGRRGQMDWRNDWNSLNSADDRVDRALDFDT